MAIVKKGRGFPLDVIYVSDNLLSASFNEGTGMAITSAGLISAAFSGDLIGSAGTATICATNLTAANICADTIVVDTALRTPATLYATATSGGSATLAGNLTDGGLIGCTSFTATTVTATLITASTLSSNAWAKIDTASATNLTAGSISGTTLRAASYLESPTIKAVSITADKIVGTSFSGSVASIGASSDLQFTHGGSAVDALQGNADLSAQGFLKILALGVSMYIPLFSGGVILS